MKTFRLPLASLRLLLAATLTFTIVFASPNSDFTSSITNSSHSGRLGVSKYVSSFLGGAVIDVPQESGDAPAILAVTAEWNVPWIQKTAGVDYGIEDNRHGVAQWIGILGNACERVESFPFLQSGTAVWMDENGDSNVSAWVEWYPAGAHNLAPENMKVSVGDRMHVIVHVYTRLTGHVYMQNLNTGQTWDSDIVADEPEDPRYAICLGYGTAQYFTEWALKNDRAYPPVFNNVTFSNVAALSRYQTHYDFGNDTQDYWNMSDPRQLTVTQPVDNQTIVVYTPDGKTWDPLLRL